MLWKYIIIFILIVIGFGAYRYLFLDYKSRELIQVSKEYSRNYYISDEGDRNANYVVLGDSTAEGVGTSRIEDTYPYKIANSLANQKKYVHVFNYSVSGAQSKDIPGQILEINTKPDYISLSVGANDTTHFVGLKSYRDNLEKIKSLLDKYPEAEVIISNTPNMSDTPAFKYIPGYYFGIKARQQNKIFNQVFIDKKYHIVDLYNEDILDKKLYAKDLVHPSGSGYSIWSRLFIKAINY